MRVSLMAVTLIGLAVASAADRDVQISSTTFTNTVQRGGGEQQQAGSEDQAAADDRADDPEATRQQRNPVSVPAARKADHVAVLTVEGMIDRVTLMSLERRFEQARSIGADAIVIELDTPGGELTATLDICHLIKTDFPSLTVAWVHPEAYSAGTIIALACPEIVVSPNSRMGDAAPIAGMPGVGLIPLPPAERAKQESPLLAEVIDSARRNHYDENLVQSFISVGVELWMLEHKQTGQRIFVDAAEYREVFGEAPPRTLTAVQSEAQKQTQAQPVRPFFDPQGQQPGGSEQEPPSAEQLRKEIEMAQTLPESRQRLSASDADDWTLVKQVVADDRLLTLTQDEAMDYGLATTIIANDEELKQYFGASDLTRYDQVWSESLVRFLISPYVRGVLIVIFLLALFAELAMPGVGVFGATALVALGLLVGAPLLVGMAQWWDVLLIILGIALILAELFVIPGTGIAGVLGAAALLVGLVGTFVSGDVTTAGGWDQLKAGLLTTLTALFAAGIGIWLISRHVGSFPLFRRLILESGASGTAASASPSMLEAMAHPREEIEPGMIGKAVTDLRPAGRAEFDGRIVDVQSIGPFVDRGAVVRVTSVGRFAIVVEPGDQV